MTYATFILSTGRCGTQWLASSLADVFSDQLEVEHEPLQNAYDARRMLAIRDSTTGTPVCPPVIAAHMDKIEDTLNTRSYIECGHPCWSTIPLLADRFRGRVRIIHLTRHPVPTCCSWLTHGAYAPPLLPHSAPKILLSPFDEGTRFTEYQSTWPELSPFEKCLYYWSEVNAFANDLESQLDAPWLRLRYEDLFAGDGLTRLLAFLDLPHRPEIFDRNNQVVDRHRFLSNAWEDWRMTEQHPRAMALAEEYGYDVNDIDEGALRNRYLKGF